MRKNNFWNRIFYSSEIKENHYNAELHRLRCQYAPELVKRILAADSLKELLEIHRDALAFHFNEGTISSDSHLLRGAEPTEDNVYLGDIYGLTTESISYWEQHKTDKYGVNNFGISEEYPVYQLVLDLYSDLLASTIKVLYKISVNKVNEYYVYGY